MSMKKNVILVFLIAFILRLLLINVAYHGDLNNNFSWGQAAIKFGLNGFYERKGFEFSVPNQPPLYIFLFGVVAWLFESIKNLTWYLNNNLGAFPSSMVWFWEANGKIILLKLPGILADLGIGYLIYRRVGLKFSVLWLFNPITWYNSAIWGGTDAIVNLFGLMSVFSLLERNLVKSILFFVVSLLFKGSLIIFLPVLLLMWMFNERRLSVWMKAVLISGFFIILVTFWFHPSFDLPVWLFNLYKSRIFPGEVGYLTANAFNLWYLVNPGRVLDSTKYFGITAHLLGYIISSIIAVAIIVKNRTQLKQDRTILYLLAMSALVSFLFFTRIHERYLYPFFPVATILVALKRKFLIPYVILSFTFLFNMYNLFWAPGIPVLQNFMVMSSFTWVLSLVNILVFIGILFGI